MGDGAVTVGSGTEASDTRCAGPNEASKSTGDIVKYAYSIGCCSPKVANSDGVDRVVTGNQIVAAVTDSDFDVLCCKQWGYQVDEAWIENRDGWCWAKWPRAEGRNSLC